VATRVNGKRFRVSLCVHKNLTQLLDDIDWVLIGDTLLDPLHVIATTDTSAAECLADRL
jgi:hypothetical protein